MKARRFPARLLTEIRSAGILSGISINPATPVEAIFDLLPYADMVLVMSVDPGFYGQAFMEPAMGRIRRLSEQIRQAGIPSVKIEVDGGIGTGKYSRGRSCRRRHHRGRKLGLQRRRHPCEHTGPAEKRRRVT